MSSTGCARSACSTRERIHIEPAPTWMSQAGFTAERRAPGSSADAVVWADVIQRAYDESELNWTYLSFMTLATLLAAIAIVLDSQILVIGAMILGPEFGPVAALGVALVRRRCTLLGIATRTLLLGFGVAIAITTLLALMAHALGWITARRRHPATSRHRRSSTRPTSGRSSWPSSPRPPVSYPSPPPKSTASPVSSSPSPPSPLRATSHSAWRSAAGRGVGQRAPARHQPHRHGHRGLAHARDPEVGVEPVRRTSRAPAGADPAEGLTGDVSGRTGGLVRCRSRAAHRQSHRRHDVVGRPRGCAQGPGQPVVRAPSRRAGAGVRPVRRHHADRLGHHGGRRHRTMRAWAVPQPPGLGPSPPVA